MCLYVQMYVSLELSERIAFFAFGKDVNIDWRHGIPQIPENKKHDKGRISIIAWGWVDQIDK